MNSAKLTLVILHLAEALFFVSSVIPQTSLCGPSLETDQVMKPLWKKTMTP